MSTTTTADEGGTAQTHYVRWFSEIGLADLEQVGNSGVSWAKSRA